MGSRQREDELRCSFCDKTQSAVAKLVSSPSSYPRAYICEQCIRTCSSAIGDVPAPSGHRSANARGCSFCHKGPHEIRLASSPGDPPGALICEECLAVCMFILKDDDPAAAN